MRSTPQLLLVLVFVLGGLRLGGASQACAQPAQRAALEPFTGHWRGSFVVTTYDGETVDSLVADHRYRWEGNVQVGTFVDRYPASGRVDTLQARNYVEDGRLVCEVTQPDGTTTVHYGRVRGDAIVWHRRTDGGLIESYRERVVETPNGLEYQIDGFGVYPDSSGGRTHLLFYGRYPSVSAE